MTTNRTDIILKRLMTNWLVSSGLLIWVILASFNHLGGCSSEKSDGDSAATADNSSDSTLVQVDSTAYADWLILEHERIRFHYPDFHPQMGTMMDMAEAFSAAIERTAKFLGMRPPDTVDVYFYTGPGQSEEMTGSVYPFVRDGNIHFTLPSYYGPPVAMYMLEKWAPGEPEFEFLKHGMIALLDYSGQNYHQSTIDYLAADSFKTLDELSQDTAIDVNKERWQSAEAASFVDFFAVRYGVPALKRLYTSKKSFDDAIETITAKSPDELQLDWIRYAEAVLKAASENDRRVIDSILNMRGRP